MCDSSWILENFVDHTCSQILNKKLYTFLIDYNRINFFLIIQNCSQLYYYIILLKVYKSNCN